VRRSRRRQPVIPREGDLVIDGRLRARLLGLHLLDIDTRFVVASARPAVTMPTVGTRGRAGVDRREHATHRPVGVSPGAPALPELTDAVRLIAEGSNLLDEATRVK
jgi:hypothetical protein